MFETICVRRQNFAGPQVMDLGFLAETLLFYGRVRLVVDAGMLAELARLCGPEALVAMVRSGRLELSYLANVLAVKTENTGMVNELHTPTTFSVIGHSEMQDVLPRVFQESTGKKGRGRRLANRIAGHIRELTFNADILASARVDYQNEEYMSSAAGHILRHLAPSYPRPAELSFNVTAVGEMLTVDSNIDFAAATRSHESSFGAGIGALSPAYVLSQVLNSNGDLYLAALYSTELATDPLSKALIEAKCRELMAGRERRATEILRFQDLVLDKGTGIREAVNSGERSVAELLHLLEAADRFRDWLQHQEPDVDIVASYYRRVTEGTWAETLPVKTLRWAVAIGVGLGVGGLGPEGIVVSASIGAADMFLVERLARGWRPSQFVEGKLRPFVGGAHR